MDFIEEPYSREYLRLIPILKKGVELEFASNGDAKETAQATGQQGYPEK